ncbi:MAG: GNAT family N-acetyltransferase [Ruminococcaceae bacterium]|nr:GNAT family N-acetyltransferase [Oscillospiraceae bacterium]
MITVKEVKSQKDIKEFIEFPLKLYKKNPFFVPPLYSDEKKLLNREKSTPAFDTVYFLCKKDGKVAGRIQGIIQKQYNELHNCSQVRFNRFDSINDKDVASALFKAVEDWAKKRGMTHICGPLGFSDLDREGLLIEGFEEESTFEEQYSFPYYPALVESFGFKKDADWLEYELTLPKERNQILERVAKRSMEMNKLHVADTSIPKKKYIEKYRNGFFDCLDECYRELYGTVPITKEAQDELVSQFMMILNKKYLVFICDEKEEVVAFGMCLPAIGNALKGTSGKLTPINLLRILKTVKNPKTIDLALVAVRPKYQKKGVNAILLMDMLSILESGKIKKFETNLNLETNTAVVAQWKYFSSRQHKRRRSYIKQIGEQNAQKN